jgi:hypothetical protein
MHRPPLLVPRRVGSEQAGEPAAPENHRFHTRKRGVLSETEAAGRGGSTATGEENEKKRPEHSKAVYGGGPHNSPSARDFFPATREDPVSSIRTDPCPTCHDSYPS